MVTVFSGSAYVVPLLTGNRKEVEQTKELFDTFLDKLPVVPKDNKTAKSFITSKVKKALADIPETHLEFVAFVIYTIRKKGKDSCFYPAVSDVDTVTKEFFNEYFSNTLRTSMTQKSKGIIFGKGSSGPAKPVASGGGGKSTGKPVPDGHATSSTEEEDERDDEQSEDDRVAEDDERSEDDEDDEAEESSPPLKSPKSAPKSAAKPAAAPVLKPTVFGPSPDSRSTPSSKKFSKKSKVVVPVSDSDVDEHVSTSTPVDAPRPKKRKDSEASGAMVPVSTPGALVSSKKTLVFRPDFAAMSNMVKKAEEATIGNIAITIAMGAYTKAMEVEEQQKVTDARMDRCERNVVNSTNLLAHLCKTLLPAPEPAEGGGSTKLIEGPPPKKKSSSEKAASSGDRREKPSASGDSTSSKKAKVTRKEKGPSSDEEEDVATGVEFSGEEA